MTSDDKTVVRELKAAMSDMANWIASNGDIDAINRWERLFNAIQKMRTATKRGSKFNVGERVRYIGKTWPERVGWTGFITQSHGTIDDSGYYSVRFDGFVNPVNCYGKSLERVE